MKKSIFVLTAFMGLYLVSCDETTINPTSEKNNTLSLVDMLTSTLWERKYTITASETATEIRTERLEFNKGLVVQSFYLYRSYPDDINRFFRTGNVVNWSLSNDTITLNYLLHIMCTSKLKIIKLTEDTLRFERVENICEYRLPFEDTIKIHTYYKVK